MYTQLVPLICRGFKTQKAEFREPMYSLAHFLLFTQDHKWPQLSFGEMRGQELTLVGNPLSL